jgi:pimeloyl-ACP methyl ester carboxylesterase
MPESTQPTVVLVHGAFTDASGFGGVVRELTTSGCRVLAPPNPLRGLAGDAAAVSAVADAIDGPVVLVGNSYGGAVITAQPVKQRPETQEEHNETHSVNRRPRRRCSRRLRAHPEPATPRSVQART